MMEVAPEVFASRQRDMSTRIGRFEIVSELAKSPSSTVYKAHDPDAGRTIALKTLHLQLSPEAAHILEDLIQEEVDSTKSLNSQNIALLHGAGEIDGKFCAGMEYVEGNSLANMIARQEGFSIWDLLDITRQVCLAFDHANSHGVSHHSLEPAKVMMQWDGTVKVLGYGTSSMVSFSPRKDRSVAPLFHYMSPEQVRGENVDLRSNIYSWGAILYEMVTERKPFDGEDVQTVRQKILDETPEPPAAINPRMNLGVSRVIMRALSKSPEERYASGQELLNDLDTAKQTTQAAAAKASQPAHGLVIPETLKAPAPGINKTSEPPATRALASVKTSKVETPLADPPAVVKAARQAAVKAAEASRQPKASPEVLNSAGEITSFPKKAAAAAASAGTAGKLATGTVQPVATRSQSAAKSTAEKATAGESRQSAKMSAAAPAAAKEAAFRVDPMMAEHDENANKSASFSELEEMPPLKDLYVAPPSPPPVNTTIEQAQPAPSPLARKKEPEKPKIITKENAQKAVKEIKNVPPKLVMYAVAGAFAIILMVVAAIALHIHSQSSDDEKASAPAPVAAPVQPQPETPAQTVQQAPAPEVQPEPEPVVTVKPRYPVKPRKIAPVAHVKAAVVPGELSINSTPEGAEIRIDSRTDPNWITPYSMAGLEPGPHSITIRKVGYSSEARNVDVASGSKSFLVVHLTQLGAMVTVTSSPVGASIFVNGKDTGRVTPAQIVAEKGAHTFLVRKQGYLDETTTVELAAGQTFNYSPILKPMGMTDDIRTVGKFNKLFAGESAAGMGKITVKTQPKGAQIAVNRRMVDKPSPVNFLLNPGNYFVDITMSGYKPVHRVINVEKNSKIELDEKLEPE